MSDAAGSDAAAAGSDAAGSDAAGSRVPRYLAQHTEPCKNRIHTSCYYKTCPDCGPGWMLKEELQEDLKLVLDDLKEYVNRLQGGS